ncbi:hypothetical protein F5148DRAFT_1296604 [Russula earlei]|uniref:Uncharacterized protein n=1 Tax=Russula earlei TaxID=71964 RepID=A0ACC0TQT3_9AGAM|nr:hypothetical protein F5148DRAFT_1296604 [Russula earlei]
MAQSGIWLAIGSSNVIQLIKQATISLFILCLSQLLADPVPRAGWRAAGAHGVGPPFNDDVLLVTYLDHGVIAWNLKTFEIMVHLPGFV